MTALAHFLIDEADVRSEPREPARMEGGRKYRESNKALQQKEPYAGKKLVSKIKKTMLVATDYSQIK